MGLLVWTLGTSNRSLEDFIEKIKSYRIGVVVDVRRFPRSRFSYFCREELEGVLEGVGVRYLYLGDRLGGYREGGYIKHMESEDFREGLSILEDVSRRERALILCSERFPWRCHRRFIASELEGRGFRVIHIIDKGKEWIRKGWRRGSRGSGPLL